MYKLINVPKLVRTLYILLWITLFIFILSKLLFNYWYPIVCNNDLFVSICNTIDGIPIIKHTVLLIFYLLSGTLITLTVYNKRKTSYKFLLIFNFIQIIIYLIKCRIILVGVLFELSILLVSSVYNVKKNSFIIYRKNWFKRNFLNLFMGIILYLFLNLWQLNILFVRGLTDILSDLPILIFICVQFDYYIYLTLTWIGVCFMGIGSWGFFFGMTTTELLAMKAKELSKAKPNEQLIARIDKELSLR